MKPEIAVGDRKLAIYDSNIVVGNRNIPVVNSKNCLFSAQGRGRR
jgi:hypothetical protein